ncbi:ribonuclease Z [Mycobacterium sp. PSTR-4-N]|uniref:ribonuclease Z n=1 Tax=Mycobacterium sp. PSTR-4-N TaxID=2917745 RepID=UPI001F1528FD|nr:ribonuclease Z [Mycobacterium sp. PSTR-4-N]MCG7594386.1 ribonuclease Z [Mycobacterium sp. PSTR-4-N]
MARELIVLGTASQVPTRRRNHNGYLLRWDDESILFDPGEGTQRQMVYAGVSVSRLTRLCLSHFHGDHCLGLPGVVARLSLDGVRSPVDAHFPASGSRFFDRLRHASEFHDVTDIRPHPIDADGLIASGSFGELHAHRLDHSVDAFGYRLVEPDGYRFDRTALSAYGIGGPAVGELQRAGVLGVAGRTVRLSDVTAPRRGQRFAFVMDTRLCDAVYGLAEGADLLVMEATFLDSDARLARDYGHLTARQAATVAAECGVRRLVLTHFSQRYPDTERHRAEAAEVYSGDLVIAQDLMKVDVPRRQSMSEP